MAKWPLYDPPIFSIFPAKRGFFEKVRPWSSSKAVSFLLKFATKLSLQHICPFSELTGTTEYYQQWSVSSQHMDWLRVGVQEVQLHRSLLDDSTTPVNFILVCIRVLVLDKTMPIFSDIEYWTIFSSGSEKVKAIGLGLLIDSVVSTPREVVMPNCKLSLFPQPNISPLS